MVDRATSLSLDEGGKVSSIFSTLAFDFLHFGKSINESSKTTVYDWFGFPKKDLGATAAKAHFVRSAVTRPSEMLRDARRAGLVKPHRSAGVSRQSPHWG